MLTCIDVKFIFDSAFLSAILEDNGLFRCANILLFLNTLETGEMFRHFEVTTKTTQPRPQVFSVNGSIIWHFAAFLTYIAKFFHIWSTLVGYDELRVGF